MSKIKNFPTNLNPIHNSSTLHSRCDIDRISPYIILRFARSDHTGNHWTYVDSDSELELIEAVFVDGIENLRHGKRKIGQCNQVMMTSFFDLSKHEIIKIDFRRIDCI